MYYVFLERRSWNRFYERCSEPVIRIDSVGSVLTDRVVPIPNRNIGNNKDGHDAWPLIHARSERLLILSMLVIFQNNSKLRTMFYDLICPNLSNSF